MKIRGTTQEDLANEVGVDRTTISKYINGHINVPIDVLDNIATALDSPELKILAFGTTSKGLIFDQVKLEFYVTAVKAIEEFKEAVEDIEKALLIAYNIDSIEELDQAQQEKFNHMLDSLEDSRHVINMLDICAHGLGADLEERNKRCLQKYRQRGYLD
jgi:transcriptional regulator with XRE-family HTH domain